MKIIITNRDSKKVKAFKILIALQNQENITIQKRDNHKEQERKPDKCNWCGKTNLIQTYFTTYCLDCNKLTIKKR